MMKKIIIIVIMFTISIFTFSFNTVKIEAFSQIPYQTYTEDSNGNLILTQVAYVPIGSISYEGFHEIKEIQLIDGDLYVLDQIEDEASQIVIFNPDFTFKASFFLPEQVIKPEGFYILENQLYIADLGLYDVGYVYIYEIDYTDYSLTLINSFGKPQTPLFGQETPFMPTKIAVDPRGNLYIISLGATNGVLQMSESGRFFGFFGANLSDQTRLKTFFISIFKPEDEIVLPPTPTNVTIDNEGFVYTITEGLETTGLRKLNVASRDFFPSSMNVIQGNVDVTIGNYQNVYTVSRDGIIREYDVSGNMLFSFGGSMIGDTRLGLFDTPISIEVTDDNHLLVADSDTNLIQIFETSEFADMVHQAIQTYQDGDYDQGLALWDEVLLYNAWFELAYKGMGDALMSEGKYLDAMEAYMKTNDAIGYSNAFWEVRNTYIEEHIGLLVIIFFGLQIFVLFKKEYNKKGHLILSANVHQKVKEFKNTSLFQELVQPLKIIRHPLDTFEDIKQKKNMNIFVPTFLYFSIIVIYFIRMLGTNYIFIGLPENQNIFLDLVLIYGGLFIFMIMNYLVCTIREGSGFFKEVYTGIAYAMIPFMLITLVMTFVSNVLTLNEAFLYNYIHQIGLVWSLILLYFMVKDIHHYDVGETLLNILITLFSMLVVIFVGFMVYVVINQSIGFFEEVIQEVILRVTGH